MTGRSLVLQDNPQGSPLQVGEPQVYLVKEECQGIPWVPCCPTFGVPHYPMSPHHARTCVTPCLCTGSHAQGFPRHTTGNRKSGQMLMEYQGPHHVCPRNCKGMQDWALEALGAPAWSRRRVWAAPRCKHSPARKQTDVCHKKVQTDTTYITSKTP